jgi:hypothetical protein
MLSILVRMFFPGPLFVEPDRPHLQIRKVRTSRIAAGA